MAKRTQEESSSTVISQSLVPASQGLPAGVVPIAVGLPGKDDPIVLRDSTFQQAGLQGVSNKQREVLMRPVDPVVEIDITPDGLVYMSHVHVRRRLNAAFGPMGWALVPLTMENVDAAPNQMFQRFKLVAEGRVVATAVGSAKYYPTNHAGRPNNRLDYADVAEAVKSNALTRCAKDLGIGSECWERRWTNDWMDEFCVRVFCREQKNETEQKAVTKWRRIDAKPYPFEFGIADDSPNQSSWRKQHAAYIELYKAEAAESRRLAEELKAARIDRQKAIAELANYRDRKAVELGIQEERPDRSVERERGDRAPAAAQRPPQQTVKPPRVVSNDLKQYTVRDCKVVSAKAASKKFYKVVMMNGREYFTFSSTVYAAMQGYLASRKPVLIVAENNVSTKGTFAMIVEYQPYRAEGESNED